MEDSVEPRAETPRVHLWVWKVWNYDILALNCQSSMTVCSFNNTSLRIVVLACEVTTDMQAAGSGVIVRGRAGLSIVHAEPRQLTRQLANHGSYY